MLGSCDQSVMIVEDDAGLREALGLLLEAEGYAVVAAHDGSDALARLAGGARPFLILLDWMMPQMDGETFRRRQLGTPLLAEIPVIVMSAAPMETFRHADVAAIVPTVLRKPLDLDSLLDMIARYHALSVRPG